MWIDAYLDQAKKLLPLGNIWVCRSGSALWSVLRMCAGQLSGCHHRAINLIVESSPQTARELLPEWEDFAGLPDDCTVGKAVTLSDRQNAVVEKLTSRGSLSVKSFYDLAARLGYVITIKEYIPFTAGRSQCGGPHVLGDRRARFYWKVTVHGPRAHWFRCGRSTAGERLGWYSPAKDLECHLKRRVPAHTIVIFDYEEAL